MGRAKRFSQDSISLFIRRKHTKLKKIKTDQNHICTFKNIYLLPAKSHSKTSVNDSGSYCTCRREGKARRGDLADVWPATFHSVSTASARNEAQNKRMQKIAKIHALVFFKVQMGASEGGEKKLFRKRIHSNKNQTTKAKGRKRALS